MNFDLTNVNSYAIQNYDATSTAQALSIISEMGVSFLFKGNVGIQTQITVPSLIKELKEVVGRDILKTYPFQEELFVVFDKLVIVIPTIRGNFKESKRSLLLKIHGDMSEVETLYHTLKKKYPQEKSNIINWFYAAEGRPKSTVVNLDHEHRAEDEYFPFIKPGVAEFQKSFIDSKENVLLLIGEPGCGKTSFVRDMILRNDLSCAVTYDEDLMRMDSFFIEFMNRSYDLLVIEDADVILQDRSDGNKIMNKLLNASDGLVQTKKKIIFTANITRLDEVDPALLRPGRCFGAITFRELNHKEAIAAARVANLPEPEDGKTLSQLFNTKGEVSIPNRFGFGV